MNAKPGGPGESVTADVELSGPDWRLRTKVTVPKGPTKLIQLLPLAQALTDAVVDAAVKVTQEQGLPISCKKGCGACCRQMVPISEVEARRIREVIEELPEPRRSEIRARFAEARRRLEASGLLEPLLQRDQWSEDDFKGLGLKYFLQGIACPFLEDESCSIHPDRPTSCREYLVTSPAENCAKPSPEGVRCVKLPFKVMPALARFDKASTEFIRWVPLILAPDWADAHPDDTPARPGPELVRQLFDHITRKKDQQAEQERPSCPTPC